MVLSIIFGEEPEEAPPPPPPPPPPTKGELFKAAVKRRASNIKETYEYQKKKRETKKLFKGVGKGSGSSSGVSSFSSASASDYEHDKFEVLPTKDQEPQVREQGYQPNDIDYWNGGNMPHYPNNYPPDNRSTFSKKTATFKDKTTSRGNTITHDNLHQGKPATINNQYRQLGESRQGTLRNESLIRREEIRQVGQSSRDPSDWEYLDSKPGNLQNRTLRKSGGMATRPKEDRGRYLEAPDSDGAMYDDRISLQTNKIHFAARTNTEQRRVLEQEERERARNTARQRRKTLAEDVIAGAAKCSQAVVGLFNRMKITVLYMCGFCSNTV